MKPEEAIKVISQPVYIQGMRQGKTAYGEAITEAIQALEKQIGKKPKLINLGWDYGDSYKDTPNTRPDCQDCGHFLRLKDGFKFKYCPSCGTKVDWEENHE